MYGVSASLTLKPRSVATEIQPSTKSVVPVRLSGLPAQTFVSGAAGLCRSQQRLSCMYCTLLKGLAEPAHMPLGRVG